MRWRRATRISGNAQVVFGAAVTAAVKSPPFVANAGCHGHHIFLGERGPAWAAWGDALTSMPPSPCGVGGIDSARS